jgi:hypothetical protein
MLWQRLRWALDHGVMAWTWLDLVPPWYELRRSYHVLLSYRNSPLRRLRLLLASLAWRWRRTDRSEGRGMSLNCQSMSLPVPCHATPRHASIMVSGSHGQELRQRHSRLLYVSPLIVERVRKVAQSESESGRPNELGKVMNNCSASTQPRFPFFLSRAVALGRESFDDRWLASTRSE